MLKYLLLAVADVEATYLAVKAYQFTSLVSVTILLHFTVPCCMALDAYLGARFRRAHYAGVLVCLVGLAMLVYADSVSANTDESNAGDPVLGDILALISAVLYAVSNVGAANLIKLSSQVEYLTFLGTFGSVISVVQLVALESAEFVQQHWSGKIVGYFLGFTGDVHPRLRLRRLPLCVFAGCLFLMYNAAGLFLARSDATLFNLSLLSVDVWAVSGAAVIFGQTINPLYFLSLFMTGTGLVIYHIAPTPLPASTPASAAREGELDGPPPAIQAAAGSSSFDLGAPARDEEPDRPILLEKV
jgi:solute carrier family 35 protein F1/2